MPRIAAPFEGFGHHAIGIAAHRARGRAARAKLVHEDRRPVHDAIGILEDAQREIVVEGAPAARPETFRAHDRVATIKDRVARVHLGEKGIRRPIGREEGLAARAALGLDVAISVGRDALGREVEGERDFECGVRREHGIAVAKHHDVRVADGQGRVEASPIGGRRPMLRRAQQLGPRVRLLRNGTDRPGRVARRVVDDHGDRGFAFEGVRELAHPGEIGFARFVGEEPARVGIEYAHRFGEVGGRHGRRHVSCAEARQAPHHEPARAQLPEAAAFNERHAPSQPVYEALQLGDVRPVITQRPRSTPATAERRAPRRRDNSRPRPGPRRPTSAFSRHPSRARCRTT